MPSTSSIPPSARNDSEPSSPDRHTASPASTLPPVDEVCRILARVLARVQASQQPVITGDAP